MCWPVSADGHGELHLEQEVIPTTGRVVRTAIREWATTAGLDPDTVEVIVLVVDEALANVVDHAYPRGPDGPEADGSPAGRVVVRAGYRACGAGVAVSVVDDGTWRPPPQDPGHRGRGVRMIGQLTERSTISPTEHGTTVRMCWARP